MAKKTPGKELDKEAVREALERSRANKGGRKTLTAWEKKAIPEGSPSKVDPKFKGGYLPEGKPNFELKPNPIENPPALSPPRGTPPNVAGQRGPMLTTPEPMNVGPNLPPAIRPSANPWAPAAAAGSQLPRYAGAAATMLGMLIPNTAQAPELPFGGKPIFPEKPKEAEDSNPLFGRISKKIRGMEESGDLEGMLPEAEVSEAPAQREPGIKGYEMSIPTLRDVQKPEDQEAKKIEADNLFAALLTLVPTALGGIMGGEWGAAAGAGAGSKGTKDYYAGVEGKNKEAKEDIEKKNKTAQEAYLKDKEGALNEYKSNIELEKAKSEAYDKKMKSTMDLAKLKAELKKMGIDDQKTIAEIADLINKPKLEREKMTNELDKEKLKIQSSDVEKQTKFLAENTKTLAQVEQIQKNMESLIGAPLSDMDKTDLPGKNIPGLGRISFYSEGARELDSIMQGIFNLRIKDASGATVTPQEALRLEIDFGKGKFRTEEELARGIKRTIEKIKAEIKQIEAGVTPQSLSTFESRGGTTTRNYGAGQSMVDPTTGKTVIKVDGGWMEVD